MKTLSKICLRLAVLSFVASGCVTEQNKKATLTIKSTTQPNSKVTINVLKNLDKINLAESTTDSAGNSSLEIVLDKPTTAIIQIGEKYGEVYLAAGYDLLIKENGRDYKIPLTFSGNGADVNNYISWVNSNVDKIKWASGKGLYALDVMEFRHRFDSLKSTIKNFHQAYLDSVTVSPDLVAMLEYKNTTKISAVQQEFKFYKLNDANNEKWAAHREGREYLSGHIAKELTKLSDELPFDRQLMVGSYADYEALINYYWRNHIYLPLSGELVGEERYEERMLPLSVARINKADVPDAARESLLAFNTNFWLGVYGITPQTDSIYSDFKETYRQSAYRAALDNTYQEFLALAPGNPAPEFEGLTREGKVVSIKDLRGKVIYIDVWATWCRPCIAEIPSSIKLQQKLAKEEGVQFLNVSIDARRSDWEKFLDKNKNWKGTHIILEPEKVSLFNKAYKFQGVPAYVLLDQAGDIVDAKALRPSDEELEVEITRLLAESTVQVD